METVLDACFVAEMRNQAASFQSPYKAEAKCCGAGRDFTIDKSMAGITSFGVTAIGRLEFKPDWTLPAPNRSCFEHIYAAKLREKNRSVYSLWNDKGERVWVKFHFKTRQEHRHYTNAEAEDVVGRTREGYQEALFGAIEAGDFPQWAKAGPYPESPWRAHRSS